MSNDKLKELAAIEASKLIPRSGIIGIGTGSTVKFLIKIMSEKYQLYKNNQFVPTSLETEKLLSNGNLTVIDDFTGRILMDFDGADEINPVGDLIKGGGGALTREKIVAANSEKFIVIADETKMVNRLGKFKVPVEIVPFLHSKTLEKIESLGGITQKRKHGKEISDNGNILADADFGIIENPGLLEKEIKMITGVVEVGLFTNLASQSIIGTEEGIINKKYK
ncbi:MAG: ribose-5-phosphate isomerase RpiA [Cuniculiplasma sp.]